MSAMMNVDVEMEVILLANIAISCGVAFKLRTYVLKNITHI